MTLVNVDDLRRELREVFGRNISHSIVWLLKQTGGTPSEAQIADCWAILSPKEFIRLLESGWGPQQEDIDRKIMTIRNQLDNPHIH